jgi:arylsulfate sulfotransferase
LRKPIRHLSILQVFFAASCFVASCFAVSCTKAPSNDAFAAAYAAAHPPTQSVYTIDSITLPTPGTILAAPFYDSIQPIFSSPGLLLVMNQAGKVQETRNLPEAAFCLNHWIINGQTRYTYLVNDPGALRWLGTDQYAGYAVITDSTLRVLQRVYFNPGDSIFQAGQELDLHDFVLISDTDCITLSYINKYVTNIPGRLSPGTNVPVLAPLIEEVSGGVVVWRWDASADTSFYGSSLQGNIFSDTLQAQDYMHMNSLFIDPRDNNLICSMRNQNQIIKINRQTGAIVWRLGGANSDFPLTADQVFLHPDHATLTDNNQTLLLFDDGDSTARPSSRVLEFQLDETGKTVTNFKSFAIPEPFTASGGSVQKIGSNYFIGGGSARYILDINYTSGQKVIEFKGTLPTYRAYKY